MGIMNRLVHVLGDRWIEYYTGKKTVLTCCREAWIPNPAGPAVYAHIHRPLEWTAGPGLVLVPGGLYRGTDLDSGRGVTATDLSSLGFCVLHYDPAGRGRTGGEEDYWGSRHQRELATIIDYFASLAEVDENDVSVISFSIGICIAAGALGRYCGRSVRLLFDWEGPSNRFNITRNDTHKPLRNMPSSDVLFWSEREPAASIGGIRCGYFRYQSLRDHMQGTYKGHALEMVNAAARGSAQWVRMNDNPIGTLFDAARVDSYHWVPFYRNHKAQVMKYILECQNQEER